MVAYPVTLEDLYNSKTADFKFERTILCPTCEGKGTKNPSATSKCQHCEGSGVAVTMRHLGFGMVQQLQEKCRHCGGEGIVIKSKDRCRQCHGDKTCQEQKVLSVYVGKGMKHGQKVVFTGEADQAPDILAGDVVLVLQQIEHAVFKRDGDDLYINKTIKLVEALCGFKFIVTHLDGRSLLVSSQAGEVIKPGDIKSIDNEGMPMTENPNIKGRLMVKFDIEFPESISPQAAKLLITVLPKAIPIGDLPMDVEEATVTNVNMQYESSKRGREAYDDEDGEDGEEGARGVTCHQQ